MPDTLRMPDGGYMRRTDVESILRSLYTLQCVEVVGMSNIGKSALLRLLAQPAVWTKELGQAGQEFLPVYVDCNRMLDVTEQGFYELVLRCLQESNAELAAMPELVGAYDRLVTPSSDFQVPLSFTRGLNAALQSGRFRLIFLLDEFDEPYQQIDSRVFLNLRALQDRHNGQIAYVTATVKPLVAMRSDGHHGEFAELFSHRRWFLAPLTRSDVERQIQRYITAYEAHFTSSDINFVHEWAGGHPRMLDGVCRVLDEAIESAGSDLSDPMERWQLHRALGRTLRADAELLRECNKLWDECSDAEQTELLSLSLTDHKADPNVLNDLSRRHLLVRVDGQHQLFCRLLTEFVQSKTAAPRAETTRLWVDSVSGEVMVDGKSVETLTNLEYKLVSLLYQNRDKIIDKYQIVTSVWGEGYIDEVDDARIEKLISRLRQKIEPDPATPRFLNTVRGRGYRMVTN